MVESSAKYGLSEQSASAAADVQGQFFGSPPRGTRLEDTAATCSGAQFHLAGCSYPCGLNPIFSR